MTDKRMIDEGYIKFECDWVPGAPPADNLITELNDTRQRMFGLGLIGHLPDLSVDYGNISIRGAGPLVMIISGTQTGHFPVTSARHYSMVTACDIEGNRVTCQGAVQASSETLTHASIYALNPDIQAVIHVHSDALWGKLLGRIPTTVADIAYGTPAMAHEFRRLYLETRLPGERLAVMAGHRGGLISFGDSLKKAENRLRQLIGANPL